MFTGRQALSSIDEALQRATGQLVAAEQRVDATGHQLLNLERQEVAQFRRLAQIRVGLLAASEIIEHLEKGEQATLRILETREAVRKDLEQEIVASGQRIEGLERQREVHMQQVDAAEALLEQREGETQKRLQQDSAYQLQLTAVKEADRIARHAQEKTRLAEQDREEKGRPYRDDPLFNYLWQRGYGISTYQAGTLVRYLDDWVARLCRYGDARANYAMLTEIPVRLKEHSDAARSNAEQALNKLEAIELKAAEADGLPHLSRALDDTLQAMSETDTELESVQQKRLMLQRRRSEFAAGKDRYFEQAIEYLAAEIRGEDISVLHHDARLTPTQDDDIAVRKLRTLELEKEELVADLERQRSMLQRHRERSEELESLRLDFKRQRYDGQSSVFADDSLVSMMLSEFLRGVLSRDGLWREIQRQHRYRKTRPNPDFGSGGFGRRKSPWGGGRGWGGGSGREGGLGGDGGFRTGGGF